MNENFLKKKKHQPGICITIGCKSFSNYVSIKGIGHYIPCSQGKGVHVVSLVPHR
jgi:hypothetical protein